MTGWHSRPANSSVQQIMQTAHTTIPDDNAPALCNDMSGDAGAHGLHHNTRQDSIVESAHASDQKLFAQGARARARWRLPLLQELRISMAAGGQSAVPLLGLLDGLPDSLLRIEIVCGVVTVFPEMPHFATTASRIDSCRGASPQPPARSGPCVECQITCLTQALRLPRSCHAVIQTEFLALERHVRHNELHSEQLLPAHLAAWVADTGAASVRFRRSRELSDAPPPHEGALIRMVSCFAAVADVAGSVAAPCCLCGLDCRVEVGPSGSELIMRRTQ